MSTWPSTLPPIRVPVSVQPQDQTLRTSMDAGPQKARRRFSAVPTDIGYPMRMTGAQHATLMTFHDTTLKGGSLEFEMSDPVTGDTEDYRFTAPPASNVIVGNEDPDKRILNVQIQIEKLP